jgi:succinate-acetate transporter protein
MGTIAAAAENLALTSVLGVLTAGAAAAAIAEFLGTPSGQGWTAIAGYTFMISAILAWYTASALMFEGVGRPILPVGMTKERQQDPAVAPGAGEPGVQKGQ